ncbi:Prophage tail length tape measure protein [Devosia enhydra]|uniref:Prophage tail length tape measure protein n=1 Tax=Devosia enhydra TaxID=665118 RepID=A0A1K2HUK4_9HYPH|nr:phage tail length tape measure family protein [Devosia enhydra]SFZ81793.1 Prophage tail length tape measure protein [Devosia enhydra]
MATDVERLVVQLSADLRQYQNAMNKAMGVTNTKAREIERRFERMSGTSVASFQRIGERGAAGLRPIGAQTSNIAAQLQDVGVQLAGGQSPFLIALQQGTQLSAALGTGQGLRGTLAGLAAGFGSLLNPVSLATIGLIGLGGAAVQYFGMLLQDGAASEEQLKEQEQLIRQVADRWGDAVPALQEYVRQLDLAKSTQDLNQATDIAVAGIYQSIASTVRDDLRPELVAARVDLQQLGADAQELDTLQAAFDDLARKADEGKASGADLEAIIKLLSNSTAGSTPIVQGLVTVLGNLRAQFDEAAAAAQRLQTQTAEALGNVPTAASFIAEQERLNALTSDQLALEAEIGRIKAEASRADILLTEEQALALAQQRLAAEERRAQLTSDGRNAGRATQEALKEQQAVLELIQVLELELATLGASDTQKEISNALRQAGAAATDEQRQRIVELVTAKQAELAATEQLNNSLRQFSDISKSALQSFISDIRQGTDATTALGNALGNIGDKILNLGIDLALNSLFSGLTGGLGGVTGGAFGSGLWGSAIFGGFRAKGGPVTPGRAYVVGEKGPELMMPGQSGMIVPNLPAPAAAAAGGGGKLTITLGPGLEASMLDQAAQQSVEIVKTMTPRMINRQAPTAVAQSQRNRVA